MKLKTKNSPAPPREAGRAKLKTRIRIQRGFTLIELILYLAIVTIAMSTLIPFAWNVIGATEKSATEQEVYTQARFLTERIKAEIRSAKGITSANSIFDVSPGKIELVVDAPTNSKVIDLAGGIVRITEGTNSPQPIHSNKTSVSSLIFTNYSSSDTNTLHVGFTITIQSLNTAGRKEYAETVTLRSSAEVRNN